MSEKGTIYCSAIRVLRYADSKQNPGAGLGVFGDATYCTNLKHYDVLYVIWLANFF